MIPRITKGTSARAAMTYDYSEGKNHEQHIDPHKIGGTIPGRTWAARAAYLDRHADAYASKEGQKTVTRTALRLADEDRALTDKEWRQVAEAYAEGMGYDLWEATKHGPEHIHLTASIYNLDGTRVNDKWDYRRAQQVCREIEREHGLIDASERMNSREPQPSPNETAKARRTGVEPERLALRRVVNECAASATSPEHFVMAMRERGVEVALNRSERTGHISGYSMHIEGHTDKNREQVWWKGSSLGKAYGWGAVAQEIEREQTQEAGVDLPEREPMRGMSRDEIEASAAGGRDGTEQIEHSEMENSKTKTSKDEIGEEPPPSVQEITADAYGEQQQDLPDWLRNAIEQERNQQEQAEQIDQTRGTDPGLEMEKELDL